MFIPHHTECGRAEAHERLPASAITPKIGLALVQSSGKLAVASGTTKPTYICMCEKSAAVAAGTIIPVIRVEPDMVFETVSSASMASINLGDKVTIASDGLRVTATTTSGVAEVVAIEDTASGGKVRVRF